MLVYGLLIAYIILVNLIVGYKTKQRKKLAVILSCLGLIFVQGLRGSSVGVDLVNYKMFFDTISQSGFGDFANIAKMFNIEYGYIFVNKIIALLFNNSWQMFIFCISVFVNVIICVFIYKNSDIPLISFLIYFGIGLFMFSFSGLRQMIAICITIISYEKLKNNKYISFILLVLMASLFHKSAIIFIIVILARKINVKEICLPFILALMLIIVLSAKPIFTALLTAFLPKYLGYINGDGSIGFFGIFLALTYFMLYFLNALNERGMLEKKSNNGFLLNIALLGALCQLFGNVSTVTGRITFYFLPSLLILFPNIVTKNKNMYVASKNRYMLCPCENSVNKCLGYAYGVFLICTMLIPDILSGYLNLLPYVFFWR